MMSANVTCNPRECKIVPGVRFCDYQFFGGQSFIKEATVAGATKARLTR